MRRVIGDQLVECRYAETCKKVIDQACLIGTSVMKGPFTDMVTKARWNESKETPGEWTRTENSDEAPAFSWVDAWNFYPDMSGDSIEDAEFAFELHRMNRSQVRKLARMATTRAPSRRC